MSKQEFIKKISESLPDFIEAQTLIDLGLFKSPSHMRNVRQAGYLPYLTIGKSLIRYFKPDVLAFLEKNYHENTQE